jgi:hypothetical protein
MQVVLPLLATVIMAAGIATAQDQPAPPAASPAISPGMTMDQVVGLLGEPEKIADLGSKKIYVYKALKVTFVDGIVVPDSEPPVADVRPDVGPLPYEIGVGGLLAVSAAFLLGRMSRPSRKVAPVPPPPINLIRRLDELEKLMDLGVLTPEEFETEKDKLRHSA